MTTNQVDIIDMEDFIPQMLKESTPAYFCHLIMMEGCPP